MESVVYMTIIYAATHHNHLNGIQHTNLYTLSLIKITLSLTSYIFFLQNNWNLYNYTFDTVTDQAYNTPIIVLATIISRIVMRV